MASAVPKTELIEAARDRAHAKKRARRYFFASSILSIAIALLPPCSKISPVAFTRWPANFISRAFCPCAGTAFSMGSSTVLSSARITSGEPARAQLLAQATLLGCDRFLLYVQAESI